MLNVLNVFNSHTHQTILIPSVLHTAVHNLNKCNQLIYPYNSVSSEQTVSSADMSVVCLVKIFIIGAQIIARTLTRSELRRPSLLRRSAH